MKRTAVYAGTFDPVTLGHVWMIEQGAKLFDQLIVAIGVNPDKRCTFSVEVRLELLRELAKRFPNVEADVFGNSFLVHYAQSVPAQFILRGIRNGGDYEFERVMRNINSDLACGVTTIFLMPPRDIAEVSSSMVKGLIGPEGWESVVKKYVPDNVFTKLLEVKK
jgi:pantetheine-phosphate adenylyltransferase